MNSEKFGGVASTDFNDLNLVDNNPTEENQGFNNLVDETELEGVDRAKLEDLGEDTLAAYEAAKTNFEKVEEEYKQKREILDRYREELENADDDWHKYLSEEAIKVAEQSVAEIGEAYQKAYQELIAAKGDVKEMNEKDKPSEEELNSLIEIAKSNKGLSKEKILWIIGGVVGGAAVIGGIVAAAHFGGGKDKAPADSSEPPIEDEFRDTGAAEEVELPDGVEIKETYEGIRDGYNQPGLYIDANSEKGTHKFADASKIAESGLVENDAREYIKYVANGEVEAMASYMFDMREMLPEEYQKLTSSQMESKLESLSDEEFDAIREYFMELIDKAESENTTLNGNYHNFWIAQKEKGDEYNHENMELRQCKTNENGTGATTLTWRDGDSIIHAMTVKLDFVNGKGCVQVVIPEGSPNEPDIDSPEEPTPPDERPPITDKEPGPEEKITPPTPVNPPQPTPDTPTDEPKSVENAERIENNINWMTSDNIGTEKLDISNVTQVSTPITVEPTYDSEPKTAPEIVESANAQVATDVENTVPQENDYSTNIPVEGTYTPVEDNVDVQTATNATESTTEATADQAADDFGIN